MQKRALYLYSIMPLDTAHTEEICEDIRLQYERGVADCALFSMTLVPEGNPPVDKVGAYCAAYDVFRDRLSEMGIPSGILVQASLGHGWVLGEKFPYQPIVQLTDGKEIDSVCPADEGFRAYIAHVFEVIASHRPAHVMLDDDFRLLFRPGGGCACPLHLSRLAARTGKERVREALLTALRKGDTEASAAFVQTQRESLIECARVMRAAIDAVDPTIPGSFCCVGTGAELGAEIAEIMAGEGNPRVLRINNARYSALGTKYFSDSFLRAAASIAKVRGRVDAVLAETDTCPQNRYSTGARSLHTHFTGSILEGARGAKHWITRLISHEPASGRAYRKILSEHRGFYETLAEMVPTLRPRGFRIPVARDARFCPGEAWTESLDGIDDWSRCVLERMGLPLYFSAEAGGVTCLSGARDAAFTDSEIREMLGGAVLLSSDSARRLIARGFGDLIGAEVRPWDGKPPMGEELLVNGNRCSRQMELLELVPTTPDSRVDSYVYNTRDRVHYERLFPGSLIYDNPAGGKVFLFAGTPRAEFHISEAYSYLNESRKRQLARMLCEAGEAPIYYPGDEDVYLRVADMEDGGIFCALFNLSSDPIEETVLVSEAPLASAERLMPNGTRRAVALREDAEGIYTLDVCCEHLLPVVLILHPQQ